MGKKSTLMHAIKSQQGKRKVKLKSFQFVWLNYKNQIRCPSANVWVSSGKSPSLSPNLGQPYDFNEREVGEPQDREHPHPQVTPGY